MKIENNFNRDDSIYRTGNKKKAETYDFQKFKTIRSFEKETYNNNLSPDDSFEQYVRLKDDTDIYKESTKNKTTSQKRKKRLKLLKTLLYLLMERKKLLVLMQKEHSRNKSRHKEKTSEYFSLHR